MSGDGFGCHRLVIEMLRARDMAKHPVTLGQSPAPRIKTHPAPDVSSAAMERQTWVRVPRDRQLRCVWR